MSASPNPYAAPRDIDVHDPQYTGANNEVVLQGRFEVDEQLLQTAARMLRTSQKVQVAILVGLLHIVPIALMVCSVAADYGRSEFRAFWKAGVFLGPLAIVAMLFWLQYRWRRGNYAELERTLGLGQWNISMTEQVLFLATPKGVRQRPLTEIRARKGRNNTLILMLEPKLSIAIPSSGQYTLDSFDDVVRTIRRYLKS